jgi:glycosyltransferase involved in cell wall biosynthesis
MRGGERVLEALAELFPSADLFTLVCDRSILPPALHRLQIRSSFLQSFPRPTRWYPYYLPLFPAATEQLDLRGYDLVISSDAATVKGIRTDADAIHICYCHTPMRCLWSGYETHCRAAGPIARLMFPVVRNRLCQWDYESAQRVSQFVANSENVRHRIRTWYDRDSVVIYPPVSTDRFVIRPQGPQRETFFLLVSHLVPYKRVDLIVEAFNKCNRRLIIIGNGPEQLKLERQAGRNIRFEGALPQAQVVDAMQRCKAFVFAGEEDFGIVMAEAQACGTPVVALGRGGAMEIVEDNLTGILFNEESVDSLLAALDRFDNTSFDSKLIRESAIRFMHQRFLDEFSSLVRHVLIQEKSGSGIRQ